MSEHTYFTVVFKRPEGYEDVHHEICAEDHVILHPDVRYESFDGNLAQQCAEMAEALQNVIREFDSADDYKVAFNNARAALARYHESDFDGV